MENVTQINSEKGMNNKSLEDSNNRHGSVSTDDICGILKGFLESSSDSRMIKLDDNLEIYYFKTLTDAAAILHEIKQKYFEDAFNFDMYFFTISETLEKDDIVKELFDGSVIALYEGETYTIKGPGYFASRGVSTTLRESSLEGGLEGFVEDLVTNVNLVRQLYQHTSLRGEHFRIGKLKTSKVALLYDYEYVNKEHLNFIKDKLNKIELPVVQAGNQLSQHIEKG